MKRIYLNYAATTPAAPEVWEAMKPWALEECGNARSLHTAGTGPRKHLKQAVSRWQGPWGRSLEK